MVLLGKARHKDKEVEDEDRQFMSSTRKTGDKTALQVASADTQQISAEWGMCEPRECLAD